MHESQVKFLAAISNRELNGICAFIRLFISTNSEPAELLTPACFLIKRLVELEEAFYTELEKRLGDINAS